MKYLEANIVIIGVDEVGRGCIYGDLVVCAAKFSSNEGSALLASLGVEVLDSKAFSSRARRERAFELIINSKVVDYEITRRSPNEIFDRGIHFAVLDAMSEACLKVAGADRCIFKVDGKFIPDALKALNSEAVVKGDSKIKEISIASIIAKVTRDREMERDGALHPQYGFEAHAGYGTKQHIEAIGNLGLLPGHRTWAQKFLKNV